MASEEEAFTLALRISDAAIQSVRELVLLILRSFGGGRQGEGLLARTGKVVGGAAESLYLLGANRVDGFGNAGLVSARTIGPDAKAVYLPHGALDRDDMKVLDREMRRAGIPFRARLDTNGNSYLFFRVEHTEAFTATLAKVAADLGATKPEIACEPIRDEGQKEYPDEFEVFGLSFKKEPDGTRWNATDPADERMTVSIWQGEREGSGAFEVSRNGRVIAAEGCVALHGRQPLEDAALAAKSALDRHHRPDERASEHDKAVRVGKASRRSEGAGDDRRKDAPSVAAGKAKAAAAKASATGPQVPSAPKKGASL